MAEHRICLIGNSHLAAWRVGLDQVPEAKRLKLDFFGAQSALMRHMELRGGVLVPTSEATRRRMAVVSGKNTEIDAGVYSHFVLVGLGFGLPQVVEPLASWQLFGAGEAADPRLGYISRPAYAAMVRSILAHSPALHLAGLLRKVSDRPVILAPQPFPSERILSSDPWVRLARTGTLAWAANVYREAAQALAREARCTLLLQPGNTVAGVATTLAHYATGSVRLSPGLDVQHPAAEPFHMNGAFGAEMLKSCLAAMA